MGRAAAILEQFCLPKDPLSARKLLEGKASAEVARMAINLGTLREKGASKLPLASRMYLTRKGLEQATDGRISSWRAHEISRLAPEGVILDATCGLGGETLALLQRGLRVISSDLDPLHAACCAVNRKSAGFTNWALVSDARFPALHPEVLILDPDRRFKAASSSGGEQGGYASRLDPTAWSPDLTAVARLLAKVPAGCVKLPPGVDANEVESLLDSVAPELPRRFTWTESGGDLRELALWTGTLAPPSEPSRQAVRLLGGPLTSLGDPVESVRISGFGESLCDEPALEPSFSCTDPGSPALRWLVEPRPSVIRAGLIGALARELEIAPIDPYMAYLGGMQEKPPLHALSRTYRVIDGAPLDKKHVRKMLKEHNVGRLTVKKRGHNASADELAARFRGSGERDGWMVVGRVGRSHRAFLVEPIE